LITKEKAEQLAKSLGESHPQDPALSVADFESLSPIYFYDVEDLRKKISSLKPRGAKTVAAVTPVVILVKQIEDMLRER